MISVIGTGYVGLVSGTCFAEMGHSVVCIDQIQQKIETLSQGLSPIYEPGLNELLQRNLKARRLSFSMSYDKVRQSPFIFLAVGTPSLPNGDADLSFFFSALMSLKPYLSEGQIIVIKSTVPMGTANKVRQFFREHQFPTIHIVNNPEFLREGNAIDDFMRPDRIVIGHQSKSAFKEMQELYAPLTQQGHPLYEMSNISAEMTKYAANTFLATKISFINEVARLCDALGADISEVRKGMTSDKRIGPHFLEPGPGYGGSCFPKDVKAFIYSAEQAGEAIHIATAVEQVNKEQKLRILLKIKQHYATSSQLSDPHSLSSTVNSNMSGKTFAIWGLAFKPNTDDVRESSAIDVVYGLLSQNASVKCFDPVANKAFDLHLQEHPLFTHLQKDLSQRVSYFENLYDTVHQADGLIILTDWPQFKSPDFASLKKLLKAPVIFDGRNLYEPTDLIKEHFSYYTFGRFIPQSL
jgi:UDPglucose 6-dehydrogenase